MAEATIQDLRGEWVSVSEASHQLRFSTCTVRTWADAGRLRSLQTPLGRLISAKDVARLAAKRGEVPA